MTEKRCVICGHPIPAKRAARFPLAVLCGNPGCVVENNRRKHTINEKRWRDKKAITDPGFRLRQLKKCRLRYERRVKQPGKLYGLKRP